MHWPAILQAWPFGFVLASIALGPALMPRRWHRHRFGILAALCVCSVASAALGSSPSLALAQTADALVRQWMPFAAMLLAIATLLAGVLGTTGAVVLLVTDGLDRDGAADLASATNQAALSPASLFWVSGLLSSILDNAPTYLVFTHLGGTTPASLAAAHDPRLAAIAAGAVFFGGLTYIGNAPNLMLRAMASHAGVRMPGFFRYTLLASGAMLPGLLIVGYGFSR